MSNGNAASQFVPPRCPIAQAFLREEHVIHASARATRDRLEAAFLYQRALELRRRRCRHSDLCARCARCFEEETVLEVAA
jgi:hypothetical protein